MITAVAFCPAAPLLVPEVGGDGERVTALRAACRAAIRRAAATAEGAGRVVIVGPAEEWAAFLAGSVGSVGGFGISDGASGAGTRIGLGAPVSPTAPVTLPPSLTIGAWLVVDALGPDAEATAIAHGPQWRTNGYEHWDGIPSLADPDTRVVVLALGEGSATATAPAPAEAVIAATAFDRQLGEAIRGGEGYRLQRPLYDESTPDPVRGAPLVDGARAWTELAWDVEAALGWTVDVDYDDAPFGVRYLVATWRGLP